MGVGRESRAAGQRSLQFQIPCVFQPNVRDCTMVLAAARCWLRRRLPARRPALKPLGSRIQSEVGETHSTCPNLTIYKIMPRRRRQAKKRVSVQWCFAPPFAPPVETIEASPARRRYIVPENAVKVSLHGKCTGPEGAKLLAKELVTNTLLKKRSLSD
jgi:hypothetical protein